MLRLQNQIHCTLHEYFSDFKVWQLYPHPETEKEVMPIYEVIEKQAQREEDSHLEKAAKILSDIDQFKHILIIGDIDGEFLRRLNNGNSLTQSSNPVQLYVSEHNFILSIISGVDDHIVKEAFGFRSPLRIVFVCKTVSTIKNLFK